MYKGKIRTAETSISKFKSSEPCRAAIVPINISHDLSGNVRPMAAKFKFCSISHGFDLSINLIGNLPSTLEYFSYTLAARINSFSPVRLSKAKY